MVVPGSSSVVANSRSALPLTLLLGLCLSVAPIGAQQGGTITGQVRSSDNEVVSAAQVFIASLGIGGLTQANGRYLLQNVPAGSYDVTVERIGYRGSSATVVVNAAATVVQDFRIAVDALSLDEIVVTGTPGGTQRRAIGNVVERLDVGSLNANPAINTLEAALSGRTPGVVIRGSSGSAGGGKRILIRGVASVGLPTDPIVYVDGVRINSERRDVERYTAMSRLNDFDPADIESIEIIKGPAAATLYGTEASAGVIQIITRTGQTGAPVFDASVELGQMWMPQRFMDRSHHFTNDPSLCPVIPCTSMDQLREVDLQAEAVAAGGLLGPGEPSFHHGLTQGYNLAVRGGTDLVRYSASLTRNDDRGVVDWNWDTRTSIRGSLVVTGSEKLSFTLSGGFSQGERSSPGSYWTNFNWGGREASVFATGPTGEYHGWIIAPQSFGEQGGRLETHGSTRSTWSLRTDLNVTDWLAHRLIVGTDQLNERSEEFESRIESSNAPFWISAGRVGERTISSWDLPVWTVDFSGTATFRFNDERLGTATSYGLQWYERAETFHSSTGENFAVAGLSTVSATSSRDGSETFVENKTFGVYFQEQLDLNNRIFLTGAIRLDDNSAFGTDFDAAVYPKVSATWVVHEESFWGVDWMDQFRLRAAWGKAGRQPDTFASSRLYSPQTGPGGQPILTPSSFGNAELGPEKGEEIEIGFDAEFLGGFAGLNFTYFNKTTKDAIVTRGIAPSLWPAVGSNATAGALQFANIGEVNAWGTETLLSLRLVQAGPVLWRMDTAFTTLGNLVTDMGGLSRIQIGRTRAHVEGFPIAHLSSHRVLSAEFVSGDRGEIKNLMCDGGTGKAGNEFGGAAVPCDEAPQLYWGNSQPSWLVNLTSTWTLFDDWQAAVNIDATGGHWMSSEYMGAKATSRPNSPEIFLQDNPIYLAYRTLNRNGLGFHEGGFAKLREVSLAYTVPDGMTGLVGVSRATLAVGVRNVAELWRQAERVYSQEIVDFEMARSDEGFQGEASGDWPPLSSWTFRMNVTF